MVLRPFSAGRIRTGTSFEARVRGAGTIGRCLDSFSLIGREHPPVAPFRQGAARLSFLVRIICRFRLGGFFSQAESVHPGFHRVLSPNSVAKVNNWGLRKLQECKRAGRKRIPLMVLRGRILKRRALASGFSFQPALMVAGLINERTETAGGRRRKAGTTRREGRSRAANCQSSEERPERLPPGRLQVLVP